MEFYWFSEVPYYFPQGVGWGDYPAVLLMLMPPPTILGMAMTALVGRWEGGGARSSSVAAASSKVSSGAAAARWSGGVAYMPVQQQPNLEGVLGGGRKDALISPPPPLVHLHQSFRLPPLQPLQGPLSLLQDCFFYSCMGDAD